jgi:hypothetical protein
MWWIMKYKENNLWLCNNYAMISIFNLRKQTSCIDLFFLLLLLGKIRNCNMEGRICKNMINTLLEESK